MVLRPAKLLRRDGKRARLGDGAQDRIVEEPVPGAFLHPHVRHLAVLLYCDPDLDDLVPGVGAPDGGDDPVFADPLVELPEVRELFATVEAICRRTGSTVVEVAQNDEQRMRIWRGRKAAFAAMGRVSPNYYVQDGVVPRTKLPEVLARIRALSERSGLGIGNVFHAGDGNLHPLICYDERIPGQSKLAEEVAGEILTYCVEAGGSITGEHGVGADKKDYMPRMFSADDLDVMQQVRDAVDPRRLCNPGKVLPTPSLCGEVPGPYRAHPVEQAGLAERF